jgi:UDP-galactopyranose mutase
VKATVLGGGFAGTTVAHLLAKDGWHVELWEKEPNLGGGCRTFFQGGHPFTYGPRLYYGYPVNLHAYNPYFDKMVEGVEVIKERRFEHGNYLQSDVVVSTIPIDEFCGYKYGELPYVGRDFEVFILPTKQIFPGDVRFCHYAGSEPHTRITEFKKITYHDSPDSLCVLEKPSKRNKLYPYLTKANMALTDKYLGSLPDNTHSIGRLGTYKYSTIEQTICQAFECYAKITGKPNPMDGQFFGIGDTSLMKDRKEETGLKRAA